MYMNLFKFTIAKNCSFTLYGDDMIYFNHTCCNISHLQANQASSIGGMFLNC